MSDWKLIYATDGSGAVTFGSLSELFNAAYRGGDIKVRYSPQAGVWWVRYCNSVNVRGTGAQIRVAATYANALNTSSGSGGTMIDEPFMLEYHVYNSNGMRSFAKVNPATGDVQTEERVMPMVWYARDYHIPLIQQFVSLFVPSLRPGGP